MAERRGVIGIVGGMSPESTSMYYLRIAHRHFEEFGRHDYPRIIITSVTLEPFIEWFRNGRWAEAIEGLERELETLARAGADFAIIATNTPHKVLPQITSPLPILSIIDAVAEHAVAAGYKRLGLTGTLLTTTDGFYEQGLRRHGLDVITPSPEDCRELDRMVFDELVTGEAPDTSVKSFRRMINKLQEDGADAIALCCTELDLLVRGQSYDIPLLDSVNIHADAAWRRALKTTD